jgi:hypothetical protein
MSLEQAKMFIEKLYADSEFCDNVTKFIHRSGFSCTVNEIRQAEWEILMENYKKEGSCPYTSEPHGYENWAG